MHILWIDTNQFKGEKKSLHSAIKPIFYLNENSTIQF